MSILLIITQLILICIKFSIASLLINVSLDLDPLKEPCAHLLILLSLLKNFYKIIEALQAIVNK